MNPCYKNFKKVLIFIPPESYIFEKKHQKSCDQFSFTPPNLAHENITWDQSHKIKIFIIPYIFSCLQMRSGHFGQFYSTPLNLGVIFKMWISEWKSQRGWGGWNEIGHYGQCSFLGMKREERLSNQFSLSPVRIKTYVKYLLSQGGNNFHQFSNFVSSTTKNKKLLGFETYLSFPLR